MLNLIVAGVAVGASVLGGAISAQGQKAQAEAEAEAARRNALIARAAAGDALRRGQADSGLFRMHASQIIGQQQAMAAASGLEGTVGTPAALAGDSRLFSELDARMIRSNAAREAWGLRNQAAQFAAHAQAAKTAGNYAFWGTLLGSAGQASSIAFRAF